ncbi:hypothetical protein RND81_12G049900 [Saponaria officinalis]|uniref:Myb/SANT-like domain-containing protein n=1 Tax=Saponaria officinalis TaxID=3572 RepID=A0AAW1H3C0_SAPOF
MNEVACGNRVDGQFKSHAYDNIIKECTEKLNHPFTKDHLKNRLKIIKSNFNEVFDLFGASGWGWNEDTEMFDNEEEVWESLLGKKPEARKWKNTPFHHFDLLAKLFSKDRATRNEAGTWRTCSGMFVPCNRASIGTDSNYLCHVSNPKSFRQNTGYYNMPSTISESSDKPESTLEAKTSDSKESADSKKAKRKTTQDILREEMSIIKEGLDNVAQGLREGNEVLENGRPQVYRPQEVFEELSRLELDSLTRRKAYHFLNAKQTRVRELHPSNNVPFPQNLKIMQCHVIT